MERIADTLARPKPGQHLSFDRALQPELRAAGYGRLPADLRVDFAAGEILAIRARGTASFCSAAGDDSHELFGSSDHDESFLQLSAGFVARTVRETAGEEVFKEVVGSALRFLRDNPGSLGGYSGAVIERLSSFIDPHTDSKSNSSESKSSGWLRRTKAGIRMGPGRYSTSRLPKAIKRRNGRGHSVGLKPS